MGPRMNTDKRKTQRRVLGFIRVHSRSFAAQEHFLKELAANERE